MSSHNTHHYHPASSHPAVLRPVSPRSKREASPSEHIPLVEDAPNTKPPLAGAESVDLEDDDRPTVTHASPGVDDGFFSERENPDAEEVDPKKHDDGTSTDDIPVIISRAGPDGGSENHPDDVDGKKPDVNHNADGGGHLHPNNFPRYPYAPSFGHDLEGGAGSFIPDLDASIPDVNVYQHKKTLAQGMMDLALFSANANQLRYVLESFNRHPYYYPSVVLISISLMFQVAVGIGLIWNATYNVKDEKEICVANRINNFTVIGIFLVTVINVFISAFGVANAPPATGNT